MFTESYGIDRMPGLIGVYGVYVSGACPRPSCPAEISFLMDTSAVLLCLAVISEQQELWTQGWKQKYFHERDWQ